MSLSKVEKFIFWSGSEKQVFLTFAGEKMENHYFSIFVKGLEIPTPAMLSRDQCGV